MNRGKKKQTCENGFSVNDLILFGCSIDVPQTDCVVIRGRQQVTIEVGVPGQTVAFLLMSSELEVRMTLATGVGFAGVFGVVEHQDVRAGGLGGDNAGVLRHVPGSVHLSFVIDLDLNFNLARN